MLNNCIPPEAFFFGVSDTTGKRMLQAAAGNTSMPTENSAYTTSAPDGQWFVYDPSQQNSFLTPAGNTSATNSSAAQQEAEASPSYDADPTAGDQHDAALSVSPSTAVGSVLGALVLALVALV